MVDKRRERAGEKPLRRHVLYAVLGALAVCGFLSIPANAQRPVLTLPAISAKDEAGKLHVLQESELYDIEREWREQFARKDAPDESFALATGYVEGHDFRSSHWRPRGLLQVSIYGKEGELRWFVRYTKAYYFERKLAAAEVDAIRRFVTTKKIDDLATYVNPLPIGGIGAVHHYFHSTEGRGRRIRIQNPPRMADASDRKSIPPTDPAWRYAEVVAFFEKLMEPDKVTVHYAFPVPAPEVQVLYAHPINEISVVWKQGKDLCVGVNWKFRVFAGGKFGKEVANPKLDGAGCRSPDGRWFLDDDGELDCYDMVKKQNVVIEENQTRMQYLPLHYVEAHRAFLLARFLISPWDGQRPNLEVLDYRLLDPVTGRSRPLDPEIDTGAWQMEPWFQRLPRRLQAVKGRPNVIWAASPESEDESRVGHYDTKAFAWLGHQSIPSLQLRTQDIWVDEDERKIYSAYSGHLLAIPLDKRHIDEQSDAIRTAAKADAEYEKSRALAQASEPLGIYVNKESPEYRIELLARGKCFLSSSQLSEGTYTGTDDALACKFANKEQFRFQRKGKILIGKDGAEWVPREQIDRMPWKDVSPVTIVVVDQQTRKPITKFSYSYTIGNETDEYSPMLVRPTEVQSADGTFSLMAPESCEIDVEIKSEELILGGTLRTYRLTKDDKKRRIEVIVSLGVAIQGEVVDEATGKPIHDAAVAPIVFYPPMGFGPDEDRAVKTDAQGKFILRRADPRRGINVSHPDYYPFNHQEVDKAGKKTGERLYSMRIAIKPGEKIVGVVKDRSGKPLDGVTVSEREGESVRTGKDGVFRLVAPWGGTLAFEKEGYWEGRARLDGDNEKELSIVLEPQPVLAGQVFGPDGQPLTVYTASAGAGREPRLKECSTQMVHDAEGRFKLSLKTELDVDGERIKPEHVWIGVKAPGLAPWEAAVDGWEGTKSIAVHLKPGVAVYGLVKVANDRAKNLSVGLIPCAIGEPEEDPSQRAEMGRMQTTIDSRGAFRFGHVCPRPYLLVISGPEISPIGRKIAVSDANLDVGSFAPQGTGSIYGVIYYPPRDDVENGRLGKRRRVGAFVQGSIFPDSFDRLWYADFDNLSSPLKADSKGRFRVDNVAAGTVSVNLPYAPAIDVVGALSRTAKVYGGKATEVRFFDPSGQWDVACKFVVGDGSPAQFASGTGMAARRKVAEISETPPRFFIELEPKDNVPTSFDASRYRAEKLDKDNQILLRDVHPGRYRVTVTDSLRDRGHRGVLYETIADFQAGGSTLTVPLGAGSITGALEWPKDSYYRTVHVTAIGKKTHTTGQAGSESSESPGIVCVRYLPEDEYTLWCRADGAGWCKIPGVSVKNAITDIGAHKLVPGGTIHGTVPPHLGTDLALTLVAADQNGVSIENRGRYEPGEEFDLSGLWPGTWTIVLKAGDKVIAEKAVTLTGTETVSCNLVEKQSPPAARQPTDDAGR